MATNADIKTTQRKYAVPLGELEWFSGIHYADGTWSQKNRVAVVAHYTETTTVTRGLKDRNGNIPSYSDTDSITMQTVTFIRGASSSGNMVEASFDYEASSKTVTVNRVSEAGFYEKVVVEKVCTSIDPSS